jgi:hypothetical protein
VFFLPAILLSLWFVRDALEQLVQLFKLDGQRLNVMFRRNAGRFKARPTRRRSFLDFVSLPAPGASTRVTSRPASSSW